MEFVGFTLRNNLFVAPMAGVTDRPFRQLCKKMGAGLAVSEIRPPLADYPSGAGSPGPRVPAQGRPSKTTAL